MSRIDDLIAELAPYGVRHVVLSEAADYSDTRVDAAELDETSFVGVDNLVVDKGGRVDASYPPNTARLTAYEVGDILLGNIRPYLKKVWRATESGGCSGDVLAVRLKPEWKSSLDSEFLYYLLSSDGFFAHNMQHAKGAKMPRGNKAAILNYRIPVPPIEVQREIVRVLDQFTQLEAELEAELELRTRQQTVLANRLFGAGPDGQHASADSQRIRLGEVASHSAVSFRVQADEIYTNLGVRWSGEGAFARDAKRGRDMKATTLNRVRAGQFIYNRMFVVEGSFALVPPELADGVVSNEFPTFDLDTSRVSPEWLLYYFQDEYTLKRVEGEVTGVERGSMKSRRRWRENQFEAFQVDLPPLETQREVVRVLRAATELAKSLREELAARRKQYEHYRDRLLTFEEAAA